MICLARVDVVQFRTSDSVPKGREEQISLLLLSPSPRPHALILDSQTRTNTFYGHVEKR